MHNSCFLFMAIVDFSQLIFDTFWGAAPPAPPVILFCWFSAFSAASICFFLLVLFNFFLWSVLWVGDFSAVSDVYRGSSSSSSDMLPYVRQLFLFFIFFLWFLVVCCLYWQRVPLWWAINCILILFIFKGLRQRRSWHVSCGKWVKSKKF